jgi:hypothetical protein
VIAPKTAERMISTNCIAADRLSALSLDAEVEPVVWQRSCGGPRPDEREREKKSRSMMLMQLRPAHTPSPSPNSHVAHPSISSSNRANKRHAAAHRCMLFLFLAPRLCIPPRLATKIEVNPSAARIPVIDLDSAGVFFLLLFGGFSLGVF